MSLLDVARDVYELTTDRVIHFEGRETRKKKKRKQKVGKCHFLCTHHNRLTLCVAKIIH